jgi:AmiR/NasT family two-component response regulator
MSPPRFIQNFSQCRALLVSRDSRALEALEATLPKLGLAVTTLALVDDEVSLPLEDLDPERDILFVDGDLHRPLQWPAGLGAVPPIPVVGIVGVEAPSRLKALIQIGATAFVPKPVHGATLYSALVLGVNAFARRRRMLSDIAEHEQRRRQRRHVVKAVVGIVTSEHVSDEIAYERLRRESMRLRISVETLSEMLVQQWAGEEAPCDASAVPRQGIGE